MKKKYFKVVFIGASKIIEKHIEAFSDMKTFKLCGIYSRTFNKAKKISTKFKLPYCCKSINDLYTVIKPDLVVIAVSVENTKKVCNEALKFPWTCLVEKPLGYNLNETIQIKKKIKNKKKLYAALNRSHYSSTNEILKLIKNDKSTRVINIYDNQNTINLMKEGVPKKVIKNWIFSNSIHLIDYCRIFARGSAKKYKKILDVKMNKRRYFVKKIIFSSGDIVLFHSIWNKPGPWSLNISTENFYFNLNPLENLSYKVKSKIKPNKTYYFENSKFDKNFKPGFRVQAQEMYKALSNKKNKMPNIDQVLFTTKIIHNLSK